MHPAPEHVWILTNTLNFVSEQKGVKDQLYRRSGKSKYSLALISSIKSRLQSVEYEPELSILDWIFLKPKQSCLAAGDKNYKVSVQPAEFFPLWSRTVSPASLNCSVKVSVSYVETQQVPGTCGSTGYLLQFLKLQREKR